MLNPVTSGLLYFFEMLIAYLFFSNIADKRRSPLFSLFLGCGCYCLCFVVNLLAKNNTYLNGMFFLLSNLLFAVSGFHLSWKQGMFYAFTLNALCAATEYAVMAIISGLTQVDIYSHRNNFSIFLLAILASKMIYFCTSYILSRLIRKDNNIYQTPTSFLIFPLVVICCLLIFWYCSEGGVLNDGKIMSLSIAAMLLFASTIIMFVTFQHQREREQEYIRTKNNNARLLIEQSYYELLENQNQQLMLYAHDAKNHLAAMQRLNRDPRIERYISKLSEQLMDYTKNCHSGNKLLDVMIDKYEFTCGQKEICFEYDVKLCNLSQLEDMDLVAVLGNLMDNAVAAAQQSQIRKLSLVTAKRNSYSIIILRNSCDTPPKVRSGKLLTSKADRKHHGYGLESVKRTLQKYGGDFEWHYDEQEHTFAVTVMIEDMAQTGTRTHLM